MIDFSSLTSCIPPRPDWLRPEQLALWDTVAPKLHARGITTEIDGSALAHLCVAAKAYFILREKVKAGAPSVVAAKAEEYRLLARRAASDFFMIPEDRVHLAPLDANGDDEELKRWFTE